MFYIDCDEFNMPLICWILIMAAKLCLPVSVWLNLCDREPEREDEVIDLIERHVRQFFKMYENKELQ